MSAHCAARARVDHQPEGIDPRNTIELSCRDMARLGQLWLNRGRWDGRQLVDPGYVAQSVSASALNPNYGFLWWLNTTGRIEKAPRSMFNASGAHLSGTTTPRDGAPMPNAKSIAVRPRL